MSRVFKPGKFMNTHPYKEEKAQPIKKIWVHKENEDYHRCDTLSSWLFIKYDLSYAKFRAKSKTRRISLKNEFLEDTKNYREEKEFYYSPEFIKNCQDEEIKRLRSLREEFPYSI